jgi:pilus assembly protein TadC
MKNKLFLISKYTAIIFTPLVIILSLAELINAMWLNQPWGLTVSLLNKFCVKILAACFILAIILTITDKEKD